MVRGDSDALAASVKHLGTGAVRSLEEACAAVLATALLYRCGPMHLSRPSRFAPAESSTLLLTAGGDSKVVMWDVATGEPLFVFQHSGAVRSVAWQEGGAGFASANDALGERNPCAINFYSIAPRKEDQSADPRLRVVDDAKPTVKHSACRRRQRC